MALPLIAVSLGDPGGIGPEVIAKALADASLRARARWVLIGPERALADAAARAGVTRFWTTRPDAGEPAPRLVEVPCDRIEPRATAEGGLASFASVELAIQMALARRPGLHQRAAAIVTGPISKEAWALAGHGEFPGHTDLLAARCGHSPHAMMFVTPRLRVVLATTHIPLARVPAAVTPERVLLAIELGARMCERLGLERPRVAVCGVNPHAGESGLLGEDEARAVSPAIAAARERGIDTLGPFPADTIFNAAVAGTFDLVVAMYHDQGLIPVKLLDRDRAVNLTAGLPIIRTSPDHGTAYDIAGRNAANPGSMHAAMSLAIELASRQGE